MLPKKRKKEKLPSAFFFARLREKTDKSCCPG